MNVVSRIIFISDEKRERDGKVYHNVNFEDMDDGKVYTRISASEEAVNKMRKYEKYNGHFNLSMWENQWRLSLVDVSPIPSK